MMEDIECSLEDDNQEQVNSKIGLYSNYNDKFMNSARS